VCDSRRYQTTGDPRFCPSCRGQHANRADAARRRVERADFAGHPHSSGCPPVTTFMKTAIVGLPMVGKTSLFTILTGVHESARVGSMEARVGVARVPDARVDALAELYKPPKITHATVEYLDFPAVSKEALRDPSYLA